MNLTQKLLSFSVLAGLGLGSTGCATHSGTGALVGGAAGAGLGAIIGHNSHHRTAEGALIGGAIGAIGGGLIGNEQDRRERDYYRDRHDDGYRYERGSYYSPPPPREYEYRRYERYDDGRPPYRSYYYERYRY